MNTDATAVVCAPFQIEAEVTKAGHDAARHNQQDGRCDRLRRSLFGLHSLQRKWVVSVCLCYSSAVFLPLCLAADSLRKVYR